jgi:hypothetical protein
MPGVGQFQKLVKIIPAIDHPTIYRGRSSHILRVGVAAHGNTRARRSVAEIVQPSISNNGR